MAEIRLIDANTLRKAFKNHPLCNSVWLQYSRELIDKAPTVEAYTPEQVKELINLNKKSSEERPRCWTPCPNKEEKPQGDCNNCDFRKFSEKFVDTFVDLMTKNDITSVEQLSEILKGVENMRKPNCVTCNHFGKCERCEKEDEE